MAYNKDGAKRAFVQIDNAYKLARSGNANDYKVGIGQAFATLAGVDSLPNTEYVGNFLAPLYKGIEDAVANARKDGFAALTDAKLLEIHEKAQGALIGPYLGMYGDVPERTDEDKQKAKVSKNLKDILDELSQVTQPTQ